MEFQLGSHFSFIKQNMKVLFFIPLLFSFIYSSDTIIVGIDPFPPCVIIDSNKVTGFDIELFETIADSIGLIYQYKQVPEFSQMFELLQNKTYDVGISGITINEEREELIDFSHPYLKSGLSILIKKEKDTNILHIISVYIDKHVNLTITLIGGTL